MIKALLIDLDGTLADSLPLLYSVYCEFLAGYHLQGTPEEFQSLNGLTLLEVMKTLVKKHALPDAPEKLAGDYLKRLDQAYLSELEIFPVARSCLVLARAKGLKIALVTSAKNELAVAFLKRHNLEFDAIITPGEHDMGKPSPDLYLKALKTLGLKPDEAIALEDSEHGLTAARTAKILTVPFQNNWDDFFQRVKKIETGHPDFSCYPIDHQFQVLVQKSRPVARSEEADRIWEEKCRRNPNLFNGKIFRFISLDEGLEGLEGLTGEFVGYKDYLCGSGIKPVSVTGVIHTEDAVLIGQRSDEVSVCPGLLETPPSGTIDPGAVMDSQIDLIRQIRKELFEETSLKEEDILSISPFALIEDKKGGTWEVCFWIPLKKRIEVFPPNREYEKFFWVERKNLPAFLENPSLIPFTRYLLTFL